MLAGVVGVVGGISSYNYYNTSKVLNRFIQCTDSTEMTELGMEHQHILNRNTKYSLQSTSDNGNSVAFQWLINKQYLYGMIDYHTFVNRCRNANTVTEINQCLNDTVYHDSKILTYTERKSIVKLTTCQRE